MSFNFFKYQRRFFSALNNYRSKENPRVYLEVTKDGEKLGKMVFEVIKLIIKKMIFQLFDFLN